MGETTNPVAETGTRARTRRAILDAAVMVLSRNPAAPMGDIATAAGVGRTTIHRYFPERSDLIAALSRDILDQIAAATKSARLEEGSALQALERLCHAYFSLGDSILLAWNEPQFMTGPEWQEETESDRALLRLVRRGHAEGTIDPALPPQWVVEMLWTALYAAWEHIRSNGATEYEALSLCLRTLRKIAAAGN